MNYGGRGNGASDSGGSGGGATAASSWENVLLANYFGDVGVSGSTASKPAPSMAWARAGAPPRRAPHKRQRATRTTSRRTTEPRAPTSVAPARRPCVGIFARMTKDGRYYGH